MTRYIAKRILLFIPTLFIITLAAFLINLNAPGDPADRLSGAFSEDSNTGKRADILSTKEYWYKKLGLNLPVFYIRITPLSVSGDLHTILDPGERANAEKLMKETGSGSQVMRLYQYTRQILSEIDRDEAGSRSSILKLRRYGDKEAWNEFIRKMDPASRKASGLAEFECNGPGNKWGNFIPVVRISADNQYHRWMFGDGHWLTGKGHDLSKGLVRGDFGISYQTMQPITDVIGEKIRWSVFFSLFSVILAYLLSIPLGIYISGRKDGITDKATTIAVFLLYSLPSFWLATLLLMLFANPDFMNLLPASGVKPAGGYAEGLSLWGKLKSSLPYFILPMICYTYSSFAFLTRTLRSSMLENLSADYIRTARAKGTPEQRILSIHAFRNSMLPMITIFVNIFPFLLGGSVILETIFSIPGMGYETVQAIQKQNYPMLTAIFTITAVLTMIGYLVADILYATADPRIKVQSGRN